MKFDKMILTRFTVSFQGRKRTETPFQTEVSVMAIVGAYAIVRLNKQAPFACESKYLSPLPTPAAPQPLAP